MFKLNQFATHIVTAVGMGSVGPPCYFLPHAAELGRAQSCQSSHRRCPRPKRFLPEAQRTRTAQHSCKGERDLHRLCQSLLFWAHLKTQPLKDGFSAWVWKLLARLHSSSARTISPNPGPARTNQSASCTLMFDAARISSLHSVWSSEQKRPAKYSTFMQNLSSCLARDGRLNS